MKSSGPISEIHEVRHCTVYCISAECKHPDPVHLATPLELTKTATESIGYGRGTTWFAAGLPKREITNIYIPEKCDELTVKKLLVDGAD